MVEYGTTSNKSCLLTTKPSKNFTLNKQIKEVLKDYFDLCIDCIEFSKMSSIPQGMYASIKLREQQNKTTKIARVNIGENMNCPQKYFTTKLMELSPLKYNSKLMNSIWGLYNRYSPHNIKSTIDEPSTSGDLQQLFANLSNLSSTNKDTADGNNKTIGKVQNQGNVAKFENFWQNIPISQSH